MSISYPLRHLSYYPISPIIRYEDVSANLSSLAEKALRCRSGSGRSWLRGYIYILYNVINIWLNFLLNWAKMRNFHFSTNFFYDERSHQSSFTMQNVIRIFKQLLKISFLLRYISMNIVRVNFIIIFAIFQKWHHPQFHSSYF